MSRDRGRRRAHPRGDAPPRGRGDRCERRLLRRRERFRRLHRRIHEVLRRQVSSRDLALRPEGRPEPGQREEIDRVCAAYPHLNDDAFVATHRDEWLR